MSGWRDLSDEEVEARLIQRDVSPEIAARFARHGRDHRDMGMAIEALLGDHE